MQRITLHPPTQPLDDADLPTFPDRGCELSPSCLSCHLPVCKHDDPHFAQRELRRRRLEAVEDGARRGLSVERIARDLGVKERTVVRRLLELYGDSGLSPWVHHPRSLLIASRTAAGRSVSEIAEELGCSHAAVSRWRRKHGLPGRSSRRRREHEELVARLMAEGRSDREIAGELLMTPEGFATWRHRRGMNRYTKRTPAQIAELRLQALALLGGGLSRQETCRRLELPWGALRYVLKEDRR